MATRRHAREAVIALLYAFDIGNESITEQVDTMLEERKIRNKQKEFALSLFTGTTERLSEIDEQISAHLKELDLDRLGHVERAILRLGTYEVMTNDIDAAVIINEAVEIAKELGTEHSPKFINGVLDALSKTLKES
jgi:N utilization substance protein B